MQSQVLDPIFLFLGSGNKTLAKHPHTLRYFKFGKRFSQSSKGVLLDFLNIILF
jgi:hypothetical protein